MGSEMCIRDSLSPRPPPGAAMASSPLPLSSSPPPPLRRALLSRVVSLLHERDHAARALQDLSHALRAREPDDSPPSLSLLDRIHDLHILVASVASTAATAATAAEAEMCARVAAEAALRSHATSPSESLGAAEQHHTPLSPQANRDVDSHAHSEPQQPAGMLAANGARRPPAVPPVWEPAPAANSPIGGDGESGGACSAGLPPFRHLSHSGIALLDRQPDALFPDEPSSVSGGATPVSAPQPPFAPPTLAPESGPSASSRAHEGLPSPARTVSFAVPDGALKSETGANCSSGRPAPVPLPPSASFSFGTVQPPRLGSPITTRVTGILPRAPSTGWLASSRYSRSSEDAQPMKPIERSLSSKLALDAIEDAISMMNATAIGCGARAHMRGPKAPPRLPPPIPPQASCSLRRWNGRGSRSGSVDSHGSGARRFISSFGPADSIDEDVRAPTPLACAVHL